MNLKLKQALLAAVPLAIVSVIAIAGSGTITVLDSTGTTRTYSIITDGSGNFVGRTGICDQSAAANCAAVTAGNQLATSPLNPAVQLVQGSGTFAISGAVTGSGTFTTSPAAGTLAGPSVQVTSPRDTSTQLVQGVGLFTTSPGAGSVVGPSIQVVSASAQSLVQPVTCVQGCSGVGTVTTSPVAGTLVAPITPVSSLGAAAVIVNNVNNNGQATMANSSPVALSSDQTVADPCTFTNKNNVNISVSSGTALIVTGVSSQRTYICSFLLMTPGATSVSLAEGSTTNCGTSNQAGVIGVSTILSASRGLPLAANGGLTYGSGNSTIAKTATNANHLCLYQSATEYLSGNITYVQR